MISQNKITKILSVCVIGFTFIGLSTIVFNRYENRQIRLTQLDEHSLEQRIVQVQGETQALRNAAQLHPVWKNWAEAKKIAQEYGLELTAAQSSGRINRSTWVGTISGDALLVLAVAKKIQEEIASEVVTYHYMGSKAKLDIAVLGTEA